MSTTRRPETPEEVVGKVLRRVEVAKMARKLQDRLALASFKAKNGMDSMSFSLVAAHVERNRKRKRAGSSIGTISDSSSSTSDHHSYSGVLSSPITAPLFSDEVNGPCSDAFGDKTLFRPMYAHSGSGSQKRNRAHSMAPPLFEASRQSWKSPHHLPQSSPVYHRQRSHFSHSHHGPNLSFASTTSTIPESPTFNHPSDNEDNDLPARSFQIHSSNMRSSPPRTPPPTRSRIARHRKANATGEEGADLLLYLATSPSPAHPSSNRARIFPPSTPPSNHLALPSSMMSTPNTGGGFMAGFSTPGQQFNFADFVNVTPSPAQGAFGSRTPGLPKTPLAAKEARKRLNFDTLAPPGGSPNTGAMARGSMGRATGLGMELGGELVS
ncbi:hypothetical protein LPUS_06850 [Lasallia pustulata]|uniref:Cyclin-dependent kinase n=1 Tax=Lasallia pustulata TaxID=136370 RepID=A0A1W5D272_9LECA|nr:hypothetical protein LPUS_06850 [Lasallia pustulata]